MTRIEEKPAEDRAALKREIIGEIKRDAVRRKVVGCGSCALIALAFLIGGGLYAAHLIARSGIADVPGIGKSAYVPTEPVRVVRPLAGTEPGDIARIVGSRATYDVRTSRLTVPITEAELTTIMSAALKDGAGASLPFPIESAQVAVETGFVEVFSTVRRDGGETTLRVRFLPSVSAGELTFLTQEVMLGGVAIPSAVGDALFGAVRPQLNEAILAAAGEAGGTLSGVEIEKGTLSIVFIVPQP